MPRRFLGVLNRRPASGAPVRFVIEEADWAVRWVGEHVRDEANRLAPGTVAVTTRPAEIHGRVVHFGSQYMWLAWGRAMGRSNRYVTSFFHGKREDGRDVARHIDRFLASEPRLSRIVVANGLVEARLIGWGVPRDKVVRIPIGVDTALFVAPSLEQRNTARAALGLAEGQVVIGSFQKDGTGWGDGMEPKMIKGPDVFVDAVARLAREFPVFVLLTGPARGFVKSRLEKIGIPYAHTYPAVHADLVRCYHALDLYIVSSREEGGPMGLMESMSSGIPIVSTRVGMAPDLIVDGQTGGLAEPDDVEGLVAKAARALITPPEERAVQLAAAREAVKVCDWSVVGRDHLEKVYRPILQV
jgi:glycosyltransferase involved in cell wall biosynthesis